MNVRLLSLVFDLAAAALALTPLFLFEQRRRPAGPLRAAGCLLFCLYLSAVFSVTGVPSATGLTFDPSVQLLPLIGIPADGPNTLLNVLLFVPLGVFLPVLWRDFRSLPQTARYAFGLSFAIEVSQLFTFRLTDVNDLLANTAGGALGCWLVLRLGWGRLPGAPEGGTQAARYIAGVFAVMTFVQPGLAGALWAFWYHALC